jgi:hypothetical protein
MRLSSIMLAAAIVAGPLPAQQPDTAVQAPMRMHEGEGMRGGMGMMGGMDMMDMMEHMREMGGMSPALVRGMLFTPAHLLMRKDILGLTDQQVEKLTALGDAAPTRGSTGTSWKWLWQTPRPIPHN